MSKIHSILFSLIALFLTVATIAQTRTALGRSQASIDPNLETSGEYDSTQTTGEFYGTPVVSQPVAEAVQPLRVLGSTDGSKRIEIDLTNQRLSAYDGDQKVYEFLISSGKWGRTPTGTFRIWSKFRYKNMSGGSKELRTYYNLPNVPYTMFFSNDAIPAARGFGIHGTYWHDNFGHPMSHGCINMRTEEAGLIYEWAGPVSGTNKYTKATTENPGTEVIIFGVAPKE